MKVAKVTAEKGILLMMYDMCAGAIRKDADVFSLPAARRKTLSPALQHDR